MKNCMGKKVLIYKLFHHLIFMVARLLKEFLFIQACSQRLCDGNYDQNSKRRLIKPSERGIYRLIKTHNMQATLLNGIFNTHLADFLLAVIDVNKCFSTWSGTLQLSFIDRFTKRLLIVYVEKSSGNGLKPIINDKTSKLLLESSFSNRATIDHSWRLIVLRSVLRTSVSEQQNVCEWKNHQIILSIDAVLSQAIDCYKIFFLPSVCRCNNPNDIFLKPYISLVAKFSWIRCYWNLHHY